MWKHIKENIATNVKSGMYVYIIIMNKKRIIIIINIRLLNILLHYHLAICYMCSL